MPVATGANILYLHLSTQAAVVLSIVTPAQAGVQGGRNNRVL